MNNQELLARLKDVKCFLFDMDGTIYLGDNILPGSIDTLEKIKKMEKKFYFLTNNSSKDPEYYIEKLSNMGIKSNQEDVLISTHSLIHYMKRKQAKKVYALGTQELKTMIDDAGIKTTENCDEDIDYVVVAFDKGLNYETLSIACQYIDEGVPYIATHPDVRCPVENGKFIPDCGSFIELIKTATGIECEYITGKPDKHMVDVVLEKTGFELNDLAVIGDRLYTDIAFGVNNGFLSVLLLSGEATKDDLKESTVIPDLVFDDIEEFGKNL